MHAVPLPLQTPLRRSHYRVQSHIANGGFGVVYLATDAAGARFAIKEAYDTQFVRRGSDGLQVTPRDDVLGGARIHAHQCRRVHEEFERFSQPHLKHPSLVPLLGCFDERGTTYLVMPYVDGQNLRKAAAQRRGSDPAWVLQLLKPISEVLALLHRNGLIHRDLKPDNILVCLGPAGQLRPVVLDTGATRDYSRHDTVNTGIRTDFGPPEIASAADARIYGRPGPGSDCFAMAGMAYLLLSGLKPPGAEERAVALARSGASDPLQPPPGVTDAVWQVLRCSLQLRVAQRHSSAAQFLAALEVAMGRRELQQREKPDLKLPADPGLRPVPEKQEARFTGREPDAIAWGGALTALAAMLTTAWLLWGPNTAAVAAAALLCLHMALALVLLLLGVAPAQALFPVGNLIEAWRLGQGTARAPARPGGR